MSGGPLAFVHAVRRRLAWRAGLRGAARSGAVMAGPALLCVAAGWWLGWSWLGPVAAGAGGALTLAAAWLAWRGAPGLGGAAVEADRALGLPGLLTTATAASVGARPAGFAGAVAARAAHAVTGRRAAQVVGLGRAVLRDGGIALVALAVVAGTAAVPTAAATEQAVADDARLDRAAALIELARSVESSGDGALAEAIRRAGRSLAAPPAERGGVPDPGAMAALERQISERRRAAAGAQRALANIEAGDLTAAAAAAPAGSPARDALETASQAPEGSAARAAALESAVADLESRASAGSGAAGLLLEEAAARVRTARAATAATSHIPSGAEPDTPAPGAGSGDQGGAGRAPATAGTPALASRLAAAAPRVLARPTWDASDDPIVRRYFEVNDR